MKHRRVFLFSGILLLLVALLSFVGVVKPQNTRLTVQQETKVSTSDVSIAIVNEDSGTVYNGDNLTMGNVLIASFVKTTPYKVETVSRAIAEKGLENGTYQVMVIIPSNFSQDALSLEEKAPKRALFQYKVSADKQVLVKQAEQAVSDLKKSFNQDMIRIYFSSVIANLQAAQEQVSGVVKTQGNTSNQFNYSLLQPLLQYSQQFTGISSSSQNATSLMDGFNNGIQNTTAAFSSILSVDKTYEPDILKIKELQQQWTNSVTNREALLSEYDQKLGLLSVDEPLDYFKKVNTVTLPKINQNDDFKKLSEHANILNTRLSDFVSDITKRNQEVATYLSETYAKKIEDAVKKSITTESSSTKTIGMLLAGLRNTINTQLKTSGQQLPFYDEATINRMLISDTDKAFLKNTMRFVRLMGINPTIQRSHYDGVVNDTYNAIKNTTLTGEATVTNVEGTLHQLILTTDNRYMITAVRINGQDVAFTTTATGVQVDSGLPINVSQLTMSYDLKLKDTVSTENMSIFTPIVSIIKVNTKEDIAQLSQSQKDTVRAQVVVLNDMINHINEDLVLLNGALESGAIASGAKLPSFALLNSTPIQVNMTSETINREYQVSDVRTLLSDTATYHKSVSQSTIRDMEKYLIFASQVKAVYDLDLRTDIQANPNQPAEGSLYQKLALTDLDKLLVSIVSDTLISDVKKQLIIPTEWLNETKRLTTDSTALQDKISQFQQLMTEVNTEVAAILEKAETVKNTLLQKPILVDSEKRDNTDVITVTNALDKDLLTLMQASRTLVDNTKNHQQVSESIRQEYNRLNEQVKALENQGVAYKNSVSEMTTVMEKEYANNNDFLKAFTQVMSNTKTGNADNAIVYDYLSNPVDGTLVDNRVTGSTSRQYVDNRTGVLMVLIISVLTLAFVYMLEHGDWRLLETNRYLSATKQTNILPLVLLASVGSLIGIIVSVVAGLKLNIPTEQLFVLIGATVVIGVSMIFMHNALIKWLKSYGLLISLLVIVVYIISLGQLFDTYYGSVHPILAYLTPLNSAENMLYTIINQQPTVWVSTGLVLITGVLGCILSIVTIKANKE